jgi:hypothetical protein
MELLLHTIWAPAFLGLLWLFMWYGLAVVPLPSKNGVER